MKRDFSFWSIHAPGWLLLLYLVYAQAISAFNYETGVRMGTQEPAEVVSEVGVAFWYGFALGDLAAYIPLLAVGLVACWTGRRWGRIILAAALGVTIYWPVVCLITIVAARDASDWKLADESPYWFVLPAIALWGAWGLLTLARQAQSGRVSSITQN